MNSRERRLLHLAFRSIEGVETASSGEGQDRFLAVYPAGKTNLPVAPPCKPRGFGRGGGRDRRSQVLDRLHRVCHNTHNENQQLSFCLLLACAAPVCPAQKRLVLIDQDGSGPGGSNQMAMLALLQAPQVEVLGITMVTGNAWRDEETLHTLRMLELTGHTDVPVAQRRGLSTGPHPGGDAAGRSR